MRELPVTRRKRLGQMRVLLPAVKLINPNGGKKGLFALE